MVGAGKCSGALFGYLNSSQQLFDKVFGAADFSPSFCHHCRRHRQYRTSPIAHRVTFWRAPRVANCAADLHCPWCVTVVLRRALRPRFVAHFSILPHGQYGDDVLSAPLLVDCDDALCHVAGAASSFQTFVRTVLAARLVPSSGAF